MQELSSENILHLLPKHIFQFDFLNDEFFDKPCDKHTKNGLDSKCPNCVESKLPKSLQEILKDDEKRKKLIIFINPPYAEAASTKTTTSTNNQNKTNVALGNSTSERYIGFILVNLLMNFSPNFFLESTKKFHTAT